MKLSIIMPYYNTEKYTPALLEVLDKQMRDDVEVIIIDDGSKVPFKTDYKWAKVIRQENTGPGLARNNGLDHMTGEYFTFIDSDDLVTDDYLEKVFEKITEGFDYCYISWKSLPGGWQCSVSLKSVEDEFPPFNLCVWNRIYKTSTFGKNRFSPNKLWSEDADYIYRLNERGKKVFIPEQIYLYRADTPNSWTKKMMNGEIDYTRIVYNVPTVTPEIRDEIIKEYENNEIILLTNDNPYPELKKKAMCMAYNSPINGTELRGVPYSGFKKIERPYTTQVLVYVSSEHDIGGIETFTYNFCYYLSKYYDITVLYDVHFDAKQMERLIKLVPVIKNDPKKSIICDTAINTRIVRDFPKNIKAKKTIQMSHTCKLDLWGQLHVPQDKDVKVFVSDVAAKTFETEKEGEYEVIHNLTIPPKDNKKVLILISATRPTPEKGMKRMFKLAEMMEKADIPYIWLYFSSDAIPNAPKGMIHMKPRLDIQPFIKMADYLVQLSDSEAFCYSIVEALENGTAVIATPLDVLPEIGFEEITHGYIVPFEVDGFDVTKLLNVPKFEYKRDNAKIVKQWRKLLGNTKPTKKYKPGKMVRVRIKLDYLDTSLGRVCRMGEYIDMTNDRAQAVIGAGFAERA